MEKTPVRSCELLYLEEEAIASRICIMLYATADTVNECRFGMCGNVGVSKNESLP
jgi:hypothetical protein